MTIFMIRFEEISFFFFLRYRHRITPHPTTDITIKGIHCIQYLVYFVKYHEKNTQKNV